MNWIPRLANLVALPLLCLLLVACPKKDDAKGRVPFGLGDDTSDEAKDVPPCCAKKDAAKDSSKTNPKADASVDATVDATTPPTAAQQFREQVIASLRIGKPMPELQEEKLVDAKKIAPIQLLDGVAPMSLSRLRWNSAQQLDVRGNPGGAFDLGAAAYLPGQPTMTSEIRILDPSAKLVVVESTESCAGLQLVIANEKEMLAGVLAGKPVAKPWLRRNQDVTTCDKKALAPLMFKVLGWTGQGIVFVLDGEFFVHETPTQPDTLPRKLDLVSGLPAPLPGGFASRDGRRVIVPTDLGFVVYDAGAPPRWITQSNVTRDSQVAFSLVGNKPQLYWLHKGDLYAGVLPPAQR